MDLEERQRTPESLPQESSLRKHRIRLDFNRCAAVHNQEVQHFNSSRKSKHPAVTAVHQTRPFTKPLYSPTPLRINYFSARSITGI